MRKLAAVILTGVMLFCMVACGNKEMQEGAPEAENPQIVTTQESNEVPEAEKPQDSPKELTTEEYYEAFLVGEIAVGTDRIDLSEYFYTNDGDSLYPQGTEFYIHELLAAVEEVYTSDFGTSALSSVEYAYIDCGKDGESELALSVNLDNDSMGPINNEFVIKRFDDRLQICARNTTVYRYEESLQNPYGIISGGGSNGAMSNYFAVSYIDAEGEKNMLYSCETNFELESFYGDLGGIYSVVAEYEEELYGSDWELLVYSFGDSEYDYETMEYEEYLNSGTYAVYPEPDDLIREIFTKAGVELHTQDEMEAIIKQNMAEKGVPEGLAEIYETIHWTPVNNAQIDEMIAYGPNPIFVSTTEEFLRAIGNNANIVLSPGIYNVTEYLRDHADELDAYDYEGENEAGVLVGGFSEWDLELFVNGLFNVRITSLDPDDMAQIVCEPRGALVMNFVDCVTVRLSNVIMGHTIEQGSCSGDVLGFNRCDYVKVTGCDLYGCGAFGTEIMGCWNVEFYDCVIHDCSYGCVEVSNSNWVNFEECKFVDCREYDMFEIFGSAVTFYRSTFERLQGDMLVMNDTAQVAFIECRFDAAAQASLADYQQNGRGIVSIVTP